LIKNRENKSFNVQYKSKKSARETFQINKKAINFDAFKAFPRRLKQKLRFRQRDIDKVKDGASGNITCLKVKPGKWYLCIPRQKNISQAIYKEASYKSVFLDPGVRTFQAFYSPDGLCGKLGDQFATRFIEPLTNLIDKLESIRSKASNWKTRRNIRNRLFKIRHKVKNKIDNFHWQTCNFLCDHFETIFLPEFKVSEMVEKTPRGRVISKKTVRQMLQLSHCDFRKKLIQVAKTKQRQLFLITEEYTTKTCGHCGTVKHVGGDKIYSCNHCGYRMDRDIHGARNICIKTLSSNS